MANDVALPALSSTKPRCWDCQLDSRLISRTDSHLGTWARRRRSTSQVRQEVAIAPTREPDIGHLPTSIAFLQAQIGST